MMARRIRLPVLATLSLVAILVACVEKKTVSKGRDEGDAVVEGESRAAERKDGKVPQEEGKKEAQVLENLHDFDKILGQMVSLPGMIREALVANSSHVDPTAALDVINIAQKTVTNNTGDGVDWLKRMADSSFSNGTEPNERMIQGLLQTTRMIAGLKEKANAVMERIKRADEDIERLREKRRAEGKNVNDDFFNKVANGDAEVFAKLDEFEKLNGPFDESEDDVQELGKNTSDSN